MLAHIIPTRHIFTIRKLGKASLLHISIECSGPPSTPPKSCIDVPLSKTSAGPHPFYPAHHCCIIYIQNISLFNVKQLTLNAMFMILYSIFYLIYLFISHCFLLNLLDFLFNLLPCCFFLILLCLMSHSLFLYNLNLLYFIHS